MITATSTSEIHDGAPLLTFPSRSSDHGPMAAAQRAARDSGPKRQDRFGLAAGGDAGQRLAMRPCAGIHHARCRAHVKIGPPRQQRQETEEPSTSLLPRTSPSGTAIADRGVNSVAPSAAAPPRRAGGRAEAARSARPGGRGRGTGQRSRSRRRRPRPALNWLTAATGAAAWPPLPARGRLAAAHRAAGKRRLNGATGSALLIASRVRVT